LLRCRDARNKFLACNDPLCPVIDQIKTYPENTIGRSIIIDAMAKIDQCTFQQQIDCDEYGTTAL